MPDICIAIKDRVLSESIQSAVGRYTDLSILACAPDDVDRPSGIVITDDSGMLTGLSGCRAVYCGAESLSDAPEFVYELLLPFRVGACIDYILRETASASGAHGREIVFGPFTLELNRCFLIIEGRKKPVNMTEKERDILLKLYEAGGTAVSRDVLLEEVWGYAEGLETHTLETHIYRLRQKIERDPSAPVFLVTDDKGYKLAGI